MVGEAWRDEPQQHLALDLWLDPARPAFWSEAQATLHIVAAAPLTLCAAEVRDASESLVLTLEPPGYRELAAGAVLDLTGPVRFTDATGRRLRGLVRYCCPPESGEPRSATTAKVFDVVLPPVGVGEARKLAKVTAGPYTWFAERGVWAFDTRAATVLVGGDSLTRLPGRLVKLIDWLNRAESVELVLAAAAPTADPSGLATALAAHGLAVSATPLKTGAWRLAVTLRAPQLDTLVTALEARGLRVDGYRVA